MKTTYKFGYAKGDNRTISVSAENDNVAKAAGELLMKAIKRSARDQELVRALTDAAVRWHKQAESYRWKGPDAAEIRRFYLAKSQSAIDAAAEVIAKGER